MKGIPVGVDVVVYLRGPSGETYQGKLSEIGREYLVIEESVPNYAGLTRHTAINHDDIHRVVGPSVKKMATFDGQ